MFLKGLRSDRLLRGESMAEHTSFRAGGPADWYYMPQTASDVADAVRAANDCGMPWYFLGAGTNVIVPDSGIRGLVISFQEGFGGIEREGAAIRCDAGVRLSRLAQCALEGSLTGLEFASGIPGTVGGGTAMNAGAYGGQLSDCLESAVLLIGEKVEEVGVRDMAMGYRTSLPKEKGCAVLGATFRLAAGSSEEIAEKMRSLNRSRREKQPLEYPSAGSVFKRPEGYFAGALIEQAGLKGTMIGGACVSEKHAGFIVNKDGASGNDILKLIRLVQDRVFEHSGVRLEREVCVFGGEEI